MGARVMIRMLAVLALASSSALGQCAGRVGKQGTQILVDGQPFFLKGICYSPFIAGDVPWVGSLRNVNFDNDMRAIKETLHANAVRVYQVLPKAFYDACRKHGLWVVQGIHLQVEEGVDPFEATAFKTLKDHVIAEVDKINLSRAGDVVLCYAVGNEVNAAVVRKMILDHQDRPRFKGTRFQVPDVPNLPKVDSYAGCPPVVTEFNDPHPFQSFIAELAEAASAREAQRGQCHLFGHASDPNQGIVLGAKDRNRLSPDQLIPVDMSFLDIVCQNVYSYFPPALRFKGYRAYLDEAARAYPGIPFVVLECGYSTSPQRQFNECAAGQLCGQPAAAQPFSFCFGMNTEDQQAQGILEQWKRATAEPARVAGYFVFEYYDEWWKSELPVTEHNSNRPEEWFGIVAVEGTTQRPVIRNKKAFETVGRMFDLSWCPGDERFHCVQTPEGVQVTVDGAEAFDSVVLKRNGAHLIKLAAGQSSYLDSDPPAGSLVYTAAVQDALVSCPAPLRCEVTVVPGAFFRRGDSTGDGALNITDAIAILSFLFAGEGALDCLDAADADDNGQLQLTDAIRILSFLFLGGPGPQPPGMEACGRDPEDDALAQCAYPPAICGG
ncbi:MAG: hypothetical protein HY721_11515 [Planctomycetes bacterium]|nr:hypothetical protein [Planctomycetota bacterium]